MADTPASDTATLHSDSGRGSTSHVDIRQAEAEFTQLQRQFSRPDRKDSATRPHSPTLKSERLPKDLENGAEAEDEERFDLREYLTSSNDAAQAAGIKHKHVGVTWDDLEVIGIGGEDNKANPPFHRGFVFLLTLSSDIRPHIPGRDHGDDYVSLHANTASRIPHPPSQVDPVPSNSYDHPQVSRNH